MDISIAAVFYIATTGLSVGEFKTTSCIPIVLYLQLHMYMFDFGGGSLDSTLVPQFDLKFGLMHRSKADVTFNFVIVASKNV